jgi:hypothetical protein
MRGRRQHPEAVKSFRGLLRILEFLKMCTEAVRMQRERATERSLLWLQKQE